MIGILLTLLAGSGTYFLYSSIAGGKKGLVERKSRPKYSSAIRTWLVQAGLGDTSPVEFAAVIGVCLFIGFIGGLMLFGAPLPALVCAAFVASLPPALSRHRREVRMAEARESWPAMIEEIRLQTSSLGKSIPQSLLDVGRNGPKEMRHAFVAAEREWMLTTDFSRMLSALRSQLCDPTADAVCETLLVAQEVGGNGLDARLGALADDRRIDLQARKDARSKQAGVRFARRFVIVVPLGMALIGMSIGNGRAAYQTSSGQVGVVVALSSLCACWLWAGRMMRIRSDNRVFGV